MISAPQLRAARGLLGWSQAEAAEAAKVGLSTVRNFETGASTPIENNLAAIQRAFEAEGVEFTNGGQPGVRLAAFTVLTAVRDNIQGVELIRGAGGKREWMTHQAAQEQAERMRRAGDPALWHALTMTSTAPLMRSLPEDAGGAGAGNQRRR
jgi:transcriptional regulator with XRE-family HTH domain